MMHLVTGTAGFIGFHTARVLLARGEAVVGVDVVNDYYDPRLKEARLDLLRGAGPFTEARIDVADASALRRVFGAHGPRRVIHLAAQAGVRYSVDHPEAYIQSNLVGFANILEACRHHGVDHLVYASTSSVYGANRAMPFGEDQGVGHPLSLYAATKRSNELMAHSYAHLYGLPCTGLRFFTVYGPWGRPDMALFRFTRAILEGRPIDVYNQGRMQRDFTYVDDIVEGILRVAETVPTADSTFDAAGAHPHPGASGVAPFRVYNIGRGAPVELMTYIRTLEAKLGRAAVCNFLPLQPGDVPATFADTQALEAAVGYRPTTSVETGIGRFVDWYRDYYGV
ncbi:MAG: NAD-dependent epimerase [Pseudomonadota bacterium]